MIPEQLVDHIKQHLAAGQLSQRKIARALGVSRATVGLIATGQRPDYAERRLQQEEDATWFGDLGPLMRCPECGGRVYMPCRLCRVRALNEAETQARREVRRRNVRVELQELLIALREKYRRPESQPPTRKAG